MKKRKKWYGLGYLTLMNSDKLEMIGGPFKFCEGFRVLRNFLRARCTPLSYEHFDNPIRRFLECKYLFTYLVTQTTNYLDFRYFEL